MLPGADPNVVDGRRDSFNPRVFVTAGVVLVVLLLVELGLTFVFHPAAARGLAAGIALEFVTGRETAFPVALAAGAPPILVGLASILQNLAMALLVLPLITRLIRLWRTREHFLARRLRRLEETAARHQAFVLRWGPAGLFAFMLVPLLPNGALVAAVLARLCGIPARHVVMPIVAATTILAFAWAFALDALLALTGRIDDRLPLAIAVVLAAAVLALSLVDEFRQRDVRRDG